MKQLLIDLNKVLTEDHIKEVAKLFNVPYASLKAVLVTETRSTGFYDGTLIPIVRFENHIFHKYTNGEYDKTRPELSSPVYNNKYNKVGIAEFFRFLKAYELNKEAAIKSTSWGLGQTMGFNYQVCSNSPLEFMGLMFKDEYSQLMAVMKFIEKNRLLESMRTQDFKTFAKIYNGGNYAANKYDTKLQEAFNKYNK